MAFLEFVIVLFGLVVLAIIINFAVFLYKLCLYGRNERSWFWPIPESNSVQMTEVSIPCTISAQVSATEGLGPNRRLSELLVRDGQLVLINYAADNGKVLVKKMSTNSEGQTSSVQHYYEDLPPSYDSLPFQCTTNSSVPTYWQRANLLNVMRSNQFLGGIILIVLILIICTILLTGVYLLCRAVCYKARHIPRRHFKCWVPNILNGIRPSRSSEMIFGAHEQEVGLVEENSHDQLQECPNVDFSQGASAVIIPNANWDEAHVGLLSSFSTSAEPINSTNTEIEVTHDSSMSPMIIPSVHSF